MVNLTGLRLPAPRGILGVQPGLDGVPGRDRCFGRQRLSIGDRQLKFDQIEIGGELSHRMFHLQAGIHLQEEELSVVVGEEFHSACPGVSDGRCSQPGRLEQSSPHGGNALNQR